jgi:Pyridoxamine 5'-phosphate oxidase
MTTTPAETGTDTSALPQGDPRLLHDPVAQRLLNSTELGRLGYVAVDGTPRVIPICFLWTGTELVTATFHGSPKIRALQARPHVALTIDRAGMPPEVLTLRGTITVEEVDGVPEEYRQMQERYYGAEQAAAAVSALEQAGAKMARLVLRPSWVGILDFQTRLPGAVAATLSGAA